MTDLQKSYLNWKGNYRVWSKEEKLKHIEEKLEKWFYFKERLSKE